MPIRILHIITSLEAGGAQAMLYKLLGAMDNNKYMQSVVVLSGQGVYGSRLAEFDIPVYALGMRPGRPNILSVAKLRKIVNEFEPTLIQGWMYHGNLAAEVARVFARRSATSLWNIRHSIDSLADEKLLTRLTIQLGARLSFRPSQIIYNSKVAALQHEAMGYRRRHRIVLANGFDTKSFQFSETNRRRVRAQLKIVDEDFLVGMIARYHPMKDHANLIASAEILGNRKPNLHYALAGIGTDASQTHLSAIIEKSGLQSRFHLLGEMRDISALMSAIDLLVLPSAYGEGFPNVLGEAMACERPCIATDVGDAAAVLGDCGEILPARNTNALTEAIFRACSLDDKIRAAIGRQGRERVVKNFSLPRIVEKYEAMYEMVSQHSASSKPAANIR